MGLRPGVVARRRCTGFLFGESLPGRFMSGKFGNNNSDDQCLELSGGNCFIRVINRFLALASLYIHTYIYIHLFDNKGACCLKSSV